jgi:predicted GNAT family acetyltransferase
VNDAADVSVRHEQEASRFAATVDGHECELDYRLDGKVLTITHTGVPDAVGGRGIAAQLTRAALAYARAEGLKVYPACSYAAVFFRRHAEYADLLVKL